MNLPAFSVKRPVFTTMVMLIIVVLGTVSLSRLRIDLFPSVEFPTVSIRTGYPGASPEVVEQQVTQIVEEIVATVPGVEELSSHSSEGYSSVRARFVWGTSIDSAALDVQATLEDEINELPDDVDRPRISKYDIDSYPVVILGISSNMDPVELTELVNDQIRYRFARIPGVAQVDLFGGWDREVRVELDPERLEALGLPLNQIIQALRDANLDRPSGRIEAGKYEVTLRAPAQYDSLEQIRDTVVGFRDGDVITLRQIADVLDTYELPDEVELVNGERGLRVGIRKQAGANTVEVARRVLEEIESANEDFPQVDIIPVVNSGNFIERSIANVSRSVLYGGGLSILVLLFFLRDWRSASVIGLSIPISIVATFALLFFGGFTLNLMSLGGLALGVGMMVDSSIVVLENIFRRRDELGERPSVAAPKGAQEVGLAILASTLTTLVIFLPLIFVPGVSGVLFRELAYVVSFSLICSLVISLSLVPMLAAKMLRRRRILQEEGRESAVAKEFAAKAEKSFKRLETRYQDLLGAALARRGLTVGLAVALLGGSFAFAPLISTEFMPPSDEGEVRISGRLEVGTRLEIADEMARRLEAMVLPAVPEVASYMVEARSGRVELDLTLVPAKERSRSNSEIAEAVRELTENKFPGMEVGVWAPQGQYLLNRLLGGGGDGLEVEVRGFEVPILEKLALEAERRIEGIEGVTQVDTSFDEGVPQQELRVDRDKVADLGLSVRDVTEALRVAVAGAEAGQYQTEGNAYRILVQLEDAEQLSIDEVLNLALRTPGGELVSLRSVVTNTMGRAPGRIQRRDQQRLVTVDVNTAGRPAGDVAEDIEEALSTIPRPSGYIFRLTGSYEEQQESFRELMLALGLALALVYMVLACQYETLRDPLIVMVAAPLAAIGVILTLLITQTSMNLQSGIGCIMLGGIVVNNAILLVDQATRLLREGMAVQDAVKEAGRRRLRPIMMTTLTTALGLLPLALGIGEGADAQAPLARAVIGGLLASTLITLVLVPVVYSLVHGKGKPTEEEKPATPVTALSSQ